jgi:hypothetical protein
MSHTFLAQVFANVPEDERWPNNLSQPKMLKPSLPSKLRRFVQTMRIGQDGHSHAENHEDKQWDFGFPPMNHCFERPWCFIVLRMPV